MLVEAVVLTMVQPSGVGSGDRHVATFFGYGDHSVAVSKHDPAFCNSAGCGWRGVLNEAVVDDEEEVQDGQ